MVFARVRSYARLAAVLVWVCACFTVRYFARVVGVFSARWERRVRAAVFRFGSRGVLGITGLRVRVSGPPPEAPFFLVANHLSYLDVFVLASRLGCVFVSRADLAQWPLFGFMVREMDTIFIEREWIRDTLRVNALIREAVQQGHGIAVFAESRVSQNGAVLPFKPALLQPAVDLNLPVHYARLSYLTPEGWPPANEVAIWRQDVNFFRHYLDVASLPHYTAHLSFGAAPLAGDDRKQLAVRLHQAVAAIPEPANAAPG